MLKRIARENVNVSLTLPASLPVNREFAPRSATQSVEKSDSVTPPLECHIEGQTGGQNEARIDILHFLPCNSFQSFACHTLFISHCSDLIKGDCAPLCKTSPDEKERGALHLPPSHIDVN